MEKSKEKQNKKVVTALYDALAMKDVQMVQRLLAPDLEWWFHGPPIHQHLMRWLTGSSSSMDNSFTFQPLSIVAFGPTVIAEGLNKDWNVPWVHAWTINHGIITHVREYFNTSVTVTWFGNGDGQSTPNTSLPDFSNQLSKDCQKVWESKLSDNKSVPGFILAL